MNLTTLTLVLAIVCSTFGAVYAGIWVKQRARIEYLFFAIGAIGTAMMAVFERFGMHASTPEEYGTILRWGHVPAWAAIVCIGWFVHLYLKAGRRWLLWASNGLRTLAVIINFIVTPNINYREIQSIRHISVLGDTLSVVNGTPNPWMLIAQGSLVLAVLFCADVTVTVWRRGDHRRALWIGGTTTFYYFANIALAVLVFWGFISWPFTLSIFFTSVVIAMGVELSSEVYRTAELSRSLEENLSILRDRELQLALSASTADVGVLTRTVDGSKITATEKWCELFEFDPQQPVNFESFIRKVHPEDRERVDKVVNELLKEGEENSIEYRILLRNGDIRWIGSKGRVEYADGEPVLFRRGSIDITKRKLAELAVHDLSARLIGAQEAERVRLARELHDDLSQSLALVSINLELLAQQAAKSPETRDHFNKVSSDLDRLSSDVHRMAHELHPSKLNLGLETALRGFCREVEAARKFKVEFEAKDVPRSLPDEVSLCLYRITQECLQNIGKHSRASWASVKIYADGDGISLSICDNGVGFDPEGTKANGSLGLISMRERVHSVNGTLSIISTVGNGTKIDAHVPLTHEAA